MTDPLKAEAERILAIAEAKLAEAEATIRRMRENQRRANTNRRVRLKSAGLCQDGCGSKATTVCRLCRMLRNERRRERERCTI